MLRGIRGAYGSDDRLHGFLRIAGLLSGLRVEVFARSAGRGLVVGNLQRGFLAGTAEEVGAKRTGLNHGDVDSEGLHLHGECVRDSFYSKLGRVVIAPARRADE